MSQDVKIPEELRSSALNELRSIVPAGSWVLFTPHDGMIVTPDPMDIMRTLATLQAVSENALNGRGMAKPRGIIGSQE
jgi:hypothetical protein